jgi:kelch-like protein 1/4/5
MFNSSLREANEREITLHDINSEALELLINYCYTGCVELKEETVEALLATATLLQMTPVVSACSSFLARQLHPSNCIGFALFAELQNCDTLFQLSTSYICQHFTQVVKNQEFFQLDADQLGNMLKNNDLNVATEQEVFHALISWVQHDEENRKKHIPKLLGFIKLPLLQPAFIVDHVEQFCDNSDCMKLVLDAMKYHLLPERYQTVTTERNKPRKSTMGRLMAIGGMDQHKGCITIETYNPRLDKWSLTKNMPTRRLQFGVALMDDKLIIVGGRDGLKTLNTVDLVDLHTMTWTSLNSMGTPRHGLGVAVLEGPLYAGKPKKIDMHFSVQTQYNFRLICILVGGHDGWSYLNTVERFDPVSKTWSYIAPMSVMRSTAGFNSNYLMKTSYIQNFSSMPRCCCSK